MSPQPAPDEARLLSLLAASPRLMAALRAARSLGLASWCIGAGAVRNTVWDALHGHERASPLADVDLAYFDAADLRPERDQALQQRLVDLNPELPWEVTNQAGVHLWFEAHFGHPVAPLHSLHDAVASWPEFATAVGVWLDGADRLRLIAPHGLADLLAMVVRRNPVRVSVQTYRERCASKRYNERWPGVVVMPG